MSSPWGIVGEMVDPGIWIARIVALAVLVPMLVAVVWFRGRALRTWWQRRQRERMLTGAASQARDLSLDESSSTDLLALGEDLDRQQMRPGDDLVAWRKALDAYAAAASPRDRSTGAVDDQRVIELCAQGRRYLKRATSRSGGAQAAR